MSLRHEIILQAWQRSSLLFPVPATFPFFTFHAALKDETFALHSLLYLFFMYILCRYKFTATPDLKLKPNKKTQYKKKQWMQFLTFPCSMFDVFQYYYLSYNQQNNILHTTKCVVGTSDNLAKNLWLYKYSIMCKRMSLICTIT